MGAVLGILEHPDAGSGQLGKQLLLFFLRYKQQSFPHGHSYDQIIVQPLCQILPQVFDQDVGGDMVGISHQNVSAEGSCPHFKAHVLHQVPNGNVQQLQQADGFGNRCFLQDAERGSGILHKENPGCGMEGDAGERNVDGASRCFKAKEGRGIGGAEERINARFELLKFLKLLSFRGIRIGGSVAAGLGGKDGFAALRLGGASFFLFLLIKLGKKSHGNLPFPVK